MSNYLTDRKIASAKTNKRLDLFDEDVKGLILRVSPAGTKTWYVRYRNIDGTQPRYKLGTYPSLRLRDARDLALKLNGKIAGGLNPAEERRKSRDKAKSETIRTFQDLAREYFLACESGAYKARKKSKSRRTLDDDRAVYGRYVAAKFDRLRLQEITRVTVKTLLRELMARGIGAQTNRTQAFIRQVFSFAIDYYDGELVTYNSAKFPSLAESRVRSRVLNDEEIALFWGAISDPRQLNRLHLSTTQRSYLPGRPMQIILQLCLLLALRESEVAGMEVIELDLGHAALTIAAPRMKNRLDHFVPLPPIAVALIEEAISLRANGESPFVFPNPRRAISKPVRGGSVGHAMKRLVAALKMDRATPHDLRRTASTRLTSERIGVLPHIRSAVLSHISDPDGGASVSKKHYDANKYANEKRLALVKLADLITEISHANSVVQGADYGSDVAAA